MELAGRLEDTWKTPGRRLEDMSTARENPWKTQIFKKNTNIILYSQLDACLPGIFARGVHVFQASSRENRWFRQRAERWLQNMSWRCNGRVNPLLLGPQMQGVEPRFLLKQQVEPVLLAPPLQGSGQGICSMSGLKRSKLMPSRWPYPS